MIRRVLREFRRAFRRRRDDPKQREIDTLYASLYALAHDLDEAPELLSSQTREAFSAQWQTHRQGKYLLTDPWFRENVTRILSEEEIQVQREWFKGKQVLDAGCGNGRWAYGLAALGANVTAVDINPAAIQETRAVLEPFGVKKSFHVAPLEELGSVLEGEKFDLVFSWGVLHHCRSFNRALDQVVERVRPDGLLYLYLYGRESLAYEADLALFKERLRYNSLPDAETRRAFLLEKAGGDESRVHNVHDVYAPLINRRLGYDLVERRLRSYGFEDVTRTIDHTEIFVRAIRGEVDEYRRRWLLPRKAAPYWFTHHE